MEKIASWPADEKEFVLMSMMILFNSHSLSLQDRFGSGIFSDKTIADKFMYSPNDATQNYPFCRLKLVVETLEHSIK